MHREVVVAVVGEVLVVVVQREVVVVVVGEVVVLLHEVVVVVEVVLFDEHELGEDGGRGAAETVPTTAARHTNIEGSDTRMLTNSLSQSCNGVKLPQCMTVGECMFLSW